MTSDTAWLPSSSREVPPALPGNRRDPTLRRALHRGEAIEVRRGVYVPVDDVDGTARRRESEVLRGIRGVAARLSTSYWISHETAALLWGCWTWRLSSVVHVTQLSHARIVRSDATIRRHRTALPVRDRATLAGIPVTTAERTVVDCARSLNLAAGLVVADSALRFGASLEVMAQIMAEATGKRGVRRARQVMDLADGRSESPGESLVRFAAWRAGLPLPTPQVQVSTELGTFRVDAGWQDLLVGVEFDGAIKYDGTLGDPAEALRAEKRRHDALVDAGWWIVRVSWDELSDMDRLGAKLRRSREIRRH